MIRRYLALKINQIHNSDSDHNKWHPIPLIRENEMTRSTILKAPNQHE